MNRLPIFPPACAAACFLLLAACASFEAPDPVDEPLRPPVDQDGGAGDTLSDPGARGAATDDRAPPREDGERFVRMRPPSEFLQRIPEDAGDAPENLPEGPFAVNFEAIPLPMFIDEVFGRLLELDFHMEESIRQADDLVTLRLSGPQSGSELFRTAMRVLSRYGVAGYRQEDDLFWFAANPDAAGQPVPLLATGATLPSVPETHRPVFQIVPLSVVRNSQVRSIVQDIFRGRELQVSEDPIRNAITLVGRPDLVRQAMATIQVLDQPVMRGRNALRIDPVYRTASDLSAELEQLLTAQGYAVAAGGRSGSGAVILVPVEVINSVFAFAADEQVLAQVRQWAEELDQVTVAPDEEGIFRYRAQNTSAESIAAVLRSVVSGGTGPARPEGERDQRDEAGRAASSGNFGSSIVVDDVRNAILYRGSGADWQQMRSLIVEMDTPTPMVLIELTIAEITLTDQRDLGIEGLIQDLDLGGFSGQVSTIGGLGLGGSGLSATFDNPGDARLLLNAFRASERVNILSRPHLLVRSGGQANIDVGTEVPIITSQASTQDFNTPTGADILQEVSFRKTGVILSVTPTVRGRGVVDLLIDQEVSEAQQTETSNINSPSIFTRRISTELTARDGRALLLGGLISESRTDGTSGVPGLSRLPLVGRLFRTEGYNQSRTELAVLLVPYVLPNHADAEDVTEAFRARLQAEHPARIEPD